MALEQLIRAPLRVALATLLTAGALAAQTPAPTVAPLPPLPRVSEAMPFYPLAVGFTDRRYAEQLPLGADYDLVGGRLPAGVRLAKSGLVSGTPTEVGSFVAEVALTNPAGGPRVLARIALTIHKPDESDLPATTPDYSGHGPLTVAQEDYRFTITSTFGNETFETALRVFAPVSPAAEAYPLFLFHHGRGFSWEHYDAILTRIASWGFVCMSIEDHISFYTAGSPAPIPLYDGWRYELGMQSGQGAMEGLVDELLLVGADATHPLYEVFDPGNMFFSGHSRGGGAVQAAHHRWLPQQIRGVVEMMPFDLRCSANTVPPGVAPAFAMEDENPRLPSLILSAEKDGDLRYPYCDKIIDRATGPTTMVTLYGACHNYVGTTNAPEWFANPVITREQQHEQISDWVVSFLKRWSGDGDASLDRKLYAGYRQTEWAAVSSWYPSVRTVLWEDAQDADPSRNLLGPNYELGLVRREEEYYPPLLNTGSLGLRHTLLEPNQTLSGWRLGLDAPFDASEHTRLVMRIGQTSNVGYEWARVWVRLFDADGNLAYHKIRDPRVGGPNLVPEPLYPHTLHRRLLDVQMETADFIHDPSGRLDWERIVALDLLVETDNPGGKELALDMVRWQ